jgi:CheY-like chemotaxis protein
MTGRGRVLVVEDNAVLGRVIEFNLSQAGFEVLCVPTGLHAWEVLQEQAFDQVVTDYEMPEMNGVELCQAIRRDPRLGHVQLIMCSARGLELDRQQLTDELRLRAFFFKPFSIRELLSVLSESEALDVTLAIAAN